LRRSLAFVLSKTPDKDIPSIANDNVLSQGQVVSVQSLFVLTAMVLTASSS
jgi:hypothetical protein